MVSPPSMARGDVIDFLLDMVKDNVDGVGYSYVGRNSGKIITRKWHLPLEKVIKNKSNNFLNHLPHTGYTLIHLRNASANNIIGDEKENHPYEIGGNIGDPNFAYVHNGKFESDKLIRAVLDNFIKFESKSNDSEVGIKCIGLIGPRLFTELVDNCGVFVGLGKDNSVYIARTGYNRPLEVYKQKNGQIIIASEFPMGMTQDSKIIQQGFYKYNKDGKLVESKEKSYRSDFVRGGVTTYKYPEVSNPYPRDNWEWANY